MRSTTCDRSSLPPTTTWDIRYMKEKIPPIRLTLMVAAVLGLTQPCQARVVLDPVSASVLHHIEPQVTQINKDLYQEYIKTFNNVKPQFMAFRRNFDLDHAVLGTEAEQWNEFEKSAPEVSWEHPMRFENLIKVMTTLSFMYDKPNDKLRAKVIKDQLQAAINYIELVDTLNRTFKLLKEGYGSNYIVSTWGVKHKFLPNVLAQMEFVNARNTIYGWAEQNDTCYQVDRTRLARAAKLDVSAIEAKINRYGATGIPCTIDRSNIKDPAQERQAGFKQLRKSLGNGNPHSVRFD